MQNLKELWYYIKLWVTTSPYDAYYMGYNDFSRHNKDENPFHKLQWSRYRHYNLGVEVAKIQRDAMVSYSWK